MMDLFYNWIYQVWDILLTIGWWSILGLVIGSFLRVLLPRTLLEQRGYKALFFSIIGGAMMPMCNFSVIPLVITLLKAGWGIECALGFLSAATLLSPAAVLYSYAYMGPLLTGFYVVSAISSAWLTGAFAHKFLNFENKTIYKTVDCSVEESLKSSVFFTSKIAVWLVFGAGIEAFLVSMSPLIVGQEMLMDPGAMSAVEVALLGTLRHVCIPDDISMIASLVAAGLMPGGVLLFIMFGIATNVPELVVLYGTAGKKSAFLYGGIMLLGGVIMCVLVQVLIAPGFIPQFSLENAEIWTSLANRFSVRTWMPARIPCTVLLLILCGYGIRNPK